MNAPRCKQHDCTDRQVAIASNNPGKLKEFDQLTATLGWTLLPSSRWTSSSVEETGSTFIENALIKARALATLSGLPTLADDSGLVVDALQGAPGIYSARYGGPSQTDTTRCKLILDALAGVPFAERTASFYCTLVYLEHPAHPMPTVAHGIWKGYIAQTCSGPHGFGYDPIFFLPDHNGTAAELPPGQKQRISHRGLAIKALIALLRAC